ncbi:MAG: TldD/PmbA family protein [Candidatus Obscuribacterales bacterium]|nr:TldD/PmbA family protein [Candidatus Obscuribacterales bacterium]
MNLTTLSRVLCSFLVLLATTSLPQATFAETPKGRVILDAMHKELDRSFEKLKKAGEAPVYYLGYRLYDIDSLYISSEYGALTRDVEPDHERVLNVDLRAGSSKVDNTHRIKDSDAFSVMRSSSGPSRLYVPLEDNELALRQAIWLETDDAFKQAQQQYARVQANKEVNVTEEDKSDDFSKEESQKFTTEAKTFEVDQEKWKSLVKRLSGIYKDYPEIYDSSVIFTAKLTKRYLVNSEGSTIADSRTDYRLYTMAQARANDGMDLWLYDDVAAVKLDEMPSEEQLTKLIKGVAENLVKLRNAPKADPYVGPAILKSKAAGVFFHEVFGHRMEGHRQKDEKEGRTFTKQMGRQVMPEFISVLDDPTLETLANIHLNGFYEFDDEGVPAQKVTLVDKGVLKSYLMSRSPVEGFPISNGHGRCDPRSTPVARMGNLMVRSEKTVPYDELRKMLIAELKKQNKSYGLVFDDIAGGFTFTSTRMPQVYSLQPLIVTKVFADGKPDELVRGVKIVGTPLTALEKIICTADDDGTFNGICGAESGSVPVSASSPSLLVGAIEVELKDKRLDKPPVLPPPLHDKEDKK